MEETLSKWIDGTDLGSIESSGGSNDNRYNFQLFEQDVSKLPTTGLAAGSTAFVLDTGDTYVFHGQTKTWVQL